MLRAGMYAHALRVNKNVERAEVRWKRDASDGWAGCGRVREWKALACPSRVYSPFAKKINRHYPPKAS